MVSGARGRRALFFESCRIQLYGIKAPPPMAARVALAAQVVPSRHDRAPASLRPVGRPARPELPRE
jgi:hypothetical protein